MNILNKLTKGFIVILAGLFISTLMSARVLAIPYSGDTTPPAPAPAFNVFTGVPSEGNESDFFRGKVQGDTNPSVNDVKTTCATGTKLTLRVYVHNGATESLNNNGTGPSIAKDTKVKIDLKNAASASGFNPTANISSSNAGSVNDGMTITCTDGRVVNLNYIAGSATQFTSAGTKAISDSIVTTGAPIGTVNPDGNVWGCWTQRVYVTLTVEVKEAPKPIPTNAVCTLDDKSFKVLDRKVSIKVSADTQNATVLAYEINWGDGTVTHQQTDSHTYIKDGTYKIQARVQVKLADGSVKWIDGDNCSKTVNFNTPVTPVTPVTTVTPSTPTTGKLVETGAGNIFGIFAATSVFGAIAHKLFASRKIAKAIRW